MDEIYLDNHSSTRPDSSILDQMRMMQQEYWPASSSPYRSGQQAFLPLISSIGKLYDLLGTEENDGFYFSPSGAEAISQVFFSTYLSRVKETGRTHFLSTDLDEAPFLLSLKKMEQFGCTGKTLPVNHFGQLTKEILEESLRPRSALLAFSWANGLTGVIHPLDDIAKACRSKDILLHVDVSNMIGKSFFRFQDLGVNFLTFDGSLVHAPRGSAGIIVQANTPFIPFSVGESSEPIAPLISLVEAVELASHNFDHLCTETARLRDRLEQNIIGALPNCVAPFSAAERLPNTSVLSFPGVFNEALLYLLNSKGVSATIGGGRFQKLSHILHLCKQERQICQGSISFSLSYETSQAEVDRASEIIVDSFKKLRSYSEGLTSEEGCFA
jgi:cysteine desulfurase